MYLIDYLRRNKIHKGWWAYRVASWYCEKRRIKMPKGRCHFGEVVLCYAPAYTFLGLLVKLLIGIGVVLRYITAPIWFPLVLFMERVVDEYEERRARAYVILVMAIVTTILYMIAMIPYTEVADTSEKFNLTVVLPLMVVAFVGPYIGFYVAAWTVEAVSPKLQPAFELGREAASALRSPTVRQVIRVMVSPAKGVPVAIRQGKPTLKQVGRMAITPAKLVLGILHLGWAVLRGSRDIVVILVTLARDGWRKICPYIEYVD